MKDEIRYGTFPEPLTLPRPIYVGNRRGPRRKTVNWKYVAVALSAVALTFYCFQLLSRWLRPAVLDTGYGVGFDLTESYGSASLREPSGSIVHLAHIDGDPRYQETMQRLALNTSRHSSPPYEWWHDGGAVAGLFDMPRRLLRSFRRLIGLPSSGDVGRIATLLQQLLAASEHTLSDRLGLKVSITNASIATPDLLALYDEDIKDAATHVGLALRQDVYFTRQPRHVDAAVLGYGLNAEDGEQEKRRIVLSIYSSREALSVEVNIKLTNRTCPLQWAQHTGYFDRSLGVDGHADGIVELEEQWKRGASALIQGCLIQEIQNKYLNGGLDNVTDVLFLGSETAYESVRNVFLDAVRAVQVKEPVAHGRGDGEEVYVASRGAAEMAWRVANRPIPEAGPEECWAENRRKMSGRIGQYA